MAQPFSYLLGAAARMWSWNPAREMFTPHELSAAYTKFTKRGPQYVDAETGLGAAAYRFGERVFLVYEESETGLVVLIHPTS
jgi:hypothetical protein